MHGDSIGTGVFAPAGSLDWIGQGAAARLSKGRDVVDVYIQPLIAGPAWWVR